MSYNVIYHIQIICIFLSFSFMFHVCLYLRSGYEKELYVPKGTITVRDSDFYLYDPNRAAIMIQTESMSSTQMGLDIYKLYAAAIVSLLACLLIQLPGHKQAISFIMFSQQSFRYKKKISHIHE